MQDRIVIEGLKIDTVIGCFDWERQIKQVLLLDLSIYTDLAAASQSDQLAHTLNYAEICELSSAILQQKQPQLIEHAAYLVLACLFAQFPQIEKINIHIRKPAIIAAAQSVGIQIERHRDYFSNRHSN